jgi:hypothetical protein
MGDLESGIGAIDALESSSKVAGIRAKLRLLVKRILRKYKYPPVKEEAAVALVLEQAETLSAEWA